MGAGDETFGDVVPDIAAVANDPAILARPTALLFDPVARDFPLDANGRYQALHPVDAEVDANLLHLQGKIPTDPKAGWPLQKIRNLYDPRAPKIIDGLVRSRLSALTVRGDITIVRIDYQPSPYGPLVAVSYVNNRLSPRPKTATTQYLRLKTAA